MEHGEPIEISDETLVERFMAGDVTAFNSIVERHQHKVYAIAYRMTRSREDSLDITQEVFLRAHRSIGQWRPLRKFRHWLYRIATNMTIDVLRKRQRRAGVIVDGEDFSMDRGIAAPSSGRGPVGRITLEERGGQIGKAIERLPERQRAVIVLRYYEDMSIKEIAAVVGCTEGTVKTHLFRATGKLRDLLSYMRSSEQTDK